MKVVNICSTVRQQADYVASFVAQLEALSARNYTPGAIRIVCDGAGQVVDEHLAAFARRCDRVRLVDEAQSEGNTFSFERKAAQWACIANQALAAALEEPASHVLYIEADLCFPFDLVDELVARDRDVIAPLVFLGGGFYDSWGFRDTAGRRVTGLGQVDATAAPVEMSSVGSCALLRTEILRQGARFPPTYESGLFVGLCAQARALGYRIWADPGVSIVHPTSSWRSQTWVVRELRVLWPAAPPRVVTLGRRIAGLYDCFVRDFLVGLQSALQGIPAGLYVLTIRYDRRTREQTWSLLLQQADPASPAVRVAEEVQLVDVECPDQARWAALGTVPRAEPLAA